MVFLVANHFHCLAETFKIMGCEESVASKSGNTRNTVNGKESELVQRTLI